MTPRTVIAALVLAILACPCSQAQIVTGTITGTITDSSGSLVPNAEVSLLNSATGRERKTQTNERGDFVLVGLDAGTYSLTVRIPGFKKHEVTNIVLATGERLALGNLQLELGNLSEELSVTAEAGAVVQTQSAERSDVITNTQIENLLIRGRNVKDLVSLLPGVVATGSADDLSSSGSLFVQGNRSTTNNIVVDGSPVTNMGNGFSTFLTISQDAVAEVKILLSNYQAEYGRMGGSNIVVVTKSGEKNFHGLLSYFKRHEQFNANDFFNNRNNISRPRYRYNTYTYSLSGPVLLPGGFNRDRSKLFFSWTQEFWPTKSSRVGRVTVPTALERTGDFSRSVDLNNRLIQIRDPFNNGAPFPGNVIPSSRLDPSGVALLRFFPEPNFFDRTISRGQYNYLFVSDNEFPKRSSSLKLDYNLNERNTIVGSFSEFREETTGGFGVVTSSANWPQVRKTWYTNGKGLSTRYTRVISPSTLNELNFSWFAQPAANTYREEDLRTQQRDVVGFRIGQFSPKANPLNILPNATFGGVPGAATINTEGRFPLFNRYHVLNWSDNLSLNRGAHNLKFGFYGEMFYRHQKKAGISFTGEFDFGIDANNPLNTNYAYANAALGVFRSYTEALSEGWMRMRNNGAEFFAQDNWRLTRRLTLDYGLRMYWISPLYERDNQMSAFVPERFDRAQQVQLIQPGLNSRGQRVGVHPETGELFAAAQIGALAPGTGNLSNGMAVAGDGGQPRGMVQSRGLMWGPRAGFAYDVRGDGKTAIRGGFGVFYSRQFTDTFSNQYIAQPPLLETPIITYGELSRLLSSSGLLYPQNVFGADGRGLLPMIMNYSLSVQQNVGHGTVVDIGYAGSLGRHLLWRRDINPIPLGANFKAANQDPTRPSPLPPAFLRPRIGYNNIMLQEAAASSNYHSLQVSAKRRFTSTLQFGLAWTWSKALDFADADFEAVTPLLDIRSWQYGLASFDRTHVLTANYVWDLPSLRTTNRWAKQALNGWRLTGISSFSSGSPLPINYTTTRAVDITGTPSQAARIFVTANPVLPKSERTFDRNFRTDVFRLPQVGTVGNAAKTLIRGPGINNWDIAVFKDFPLDERLRLQFRCELYNAFNHTQFEGLDTTARFDPTTGQQVNLAFGQFTSSREPRRIQFALRLQF
ncbi:MAG: carboxypeptidase regulatory-like domain-containing protein [Acidobacteriota bacterium]